MEALTTTSHRPAAAAAGASAHGQRRATAAVLPRRRRPACARLRALPPELTEILAPKLVPGSPADTGDVSALIPVSALMLVLYFVSNWVVPEFLMKGLNKPKDDEAAAATSMSISGDGGDATRRKTRLKVKRKKKAKTAVEV